jgi:fructose/tagatose bisphosphate aldolase
MLKADEEYFAKFGEPLFSSHMLDLSEEDHEENVNICAEYLKKMAPMKLILEMEIGITGGVEDGVNNESVDASKLYSTPADTWMVYEKLNPISPMFTIAAAFGNVHGVYKPGTRAAKGGARARTDSHDRRIRALANACSAHTHAHTRRVHTSAHTSAPQGLINKS